jgi:hypothetical protein
MIIVLMPSFRENVNYLPALSEEEHAGGIGPGGAARKKSINDFRSWAVSNQNPTTGSRDQARD